MTCGYNPYTLPTIDFVGGETQDLIFNMYFYKNKKPFSLTGSVCNFSIINFTNKTGTPIITKTMTVCESEDYGVDNVLKVTLNPQETVALAGKYIYQITIQAINGDVEIPKQGILYITHNIDRDFIWQQTGTVPDDTTTTPTFTYGAWGAF